MRINLTADVWERMKAFVDLCPNEISGLGHVSRDEAGNIVVDRIEIFQQVVSGAHSTIDPAALAAFQSEMVKAGGSMRDWCFWWHSHCHMEAFFSGTDTGTISTSTEFPYLVSLVTNKKHEFKARVDVFAPFGLSMPLDVAIIPPPANQAILDLCREEIAEKVTTHRAQPYQQVGFHHAAPGYPSAVRYPVSKPKQRKVHKGGMLLGETEYWVRKQKLQEQMRKHADKGQVKKAQRALMNLQALMRYGEIRGWDQDTNDNQLSLIRPTTQDAG